MARSQCCSRPLPISRKKICSRQSQKVDLAFVSGALIGLIQVHGPWIIAVVVALESAGVPLPGETILVAAALLAATTNQIDIAVVVAAAAIGAIIGDGCQSALEWDPLSASKRDPFDRRVLLVALASSELVGVAETA